LEKPSKPEHWTNARLQAFIVGVLRAGHNRWPFKYEVKNEAKTTKHVNPNSGRMAQFYKCAVCSEEFTNKEVEVDHIDPVVDPKVGFVDWNTFITRLFSSKDNYQLLCKSCHNIKSNLEKKKKKL
jgi:5-methylcytosine-specific restriction endonuclease McrA